MADGIHQAKHRDNRFGQRNDYAPHKPQVAAPVHLARFIKLIRDGRLKESSGYNHLPDPNSTRNKQCPSRIKHSERFHNQIRWDESAGEQHRKRNKEHDEITAEK